MNDKVKQIFEILGVEPEEEFKCDEFGDKLYKFNGELRLYYLSSIDNWVLSGYNVGDILGCRIIKIPQKPKLTNKDKIAIKFLKNCGFHYVVYEKNKFFDVIHAYENEPEKNTTVAGDIIWIGCGANCNFPINTFDIVIDDNEVFCLDKFSNEELKEC